MNRLDDIDSRLKGTGYLTIGQAVSDALELRAMVDGEMDARFKLDAALRQKDDAMSKLFDLLKSAGVDYSHLIS